MSIQQRLPGFGEEAFFQDALSTYRALIAATRHLNQTFMQAWRDGLLDLAWEEMRKDFPEHKLWLHYFIRTRGLGDIKIGKTNQIGARFKAILSMSARGAELIACYPADENHEGGLKEDFVRDRLNGEWFRASNDILDYLRMIGSDVDAFDLDYRHFYFGEKVPRPGRKQ